VQSRGSSSEFGGEEEKEEEEAPDPPFCIAYLSIYLSIFQQTCTTTTTRFLFCLETLTMTFVAAAASSRDHPCLRAVVKFHSRLGNGCWL
jgi:hypothetical protein